MPNLTTARAGQPASDVVVCLIGKDDAFANVKTGETAVVLYRG